MSNDAVGAHFQCPFYFATANNHITCEGLIKNTKTRHTFKSKKKKLEFQYKYCCDFENYPNCIHCQTIQSLYDRGLR